MPPKTTRAGRSATATPRAVASGRATRSQNRQSADLPVVASTPTRLAAKADLASAPSYAYGSGGKALAPPRQTSDIRNQSRSELLQNALKDSKRSLAAQRSPEIKVSDSDEEEEAEAEEPEPRPTPTPKARAKAAPQIRTSQRSKAAEKAYEEPLEEHEDRESEEAEEEEEGQDTSEDEAEGSGRNKSYGTRTNLLKAERQSATVVFPLQKPSKASRKPAAARTSRKPASRPAVRHTSPADADTTTFADRTFSYFAEGWVSNPAGLEGSGWGSSLLKYLLVLAIVVGTVYLGQAADIGSKVSVLPYTFRDLLPSPRILDVGNATALNGLTREMQSLGARMSRLERRADQQFSSALAAATSAAANAATKHGDECCSTGDSEDGSQAINFFAPNSGVQVDPYLTSPTRATPANAAFRTWQQLLIPLGIAGPKAPGPATAFAPWSDMGDCWCAADAHGRSQLVALLGRSAQPRELVIEHIPRTETLDPGATPRGVQLLAQIADPELRDRAALAVMNDIGPVTRDGTTVGIAPGGDGLDKSWIVVANGEFDLSGPNVQRFPVARGLAGVDLHVRKVAVRTLGNWGDGVGDGTDHVCLYRVKLLGSTSDMTSMMPPI